MKRTYKITSDDVRREICLQVTQADFGKVVIIQDATRTLQQNARMWAMLSDVSEQVDWYGNKLTPDEWKDVFSASLKAQKVVPGLEGGFVVCGQRTSKMTVAEMGDLMTLMEAFGADKGVKFSAPEWEWS